MGTEGCFTIACEATASVLRQNAQALLTILSAVVSDPLYRWSISPLQARLVQQGDKEHEEGEDDEDGEYSGRENETTRDILGSSGKKCGKEQNQNEAANRAIEKIHQKLQGYEEGNSGERQSVEGQVQLLINSARDPDNLCNLFPGWAPFI